MNIILRMAKKLGLIEPHDTFDSLESMPRDVLYIPENHLIEGQISTDLAVVVAGRVEGSINIRGDATLTVLETGSINNGLVSAKNAVVDGALRNAQVDVDRLYVSESGKIVGQSEILYAKLGKHDDSQIDAASRKRQNDRDGYVYVAKGKMDLVESTSLV